MRPKRAVMATAGFLMSLTLLLCLREDVLGGNFKRNVNFNNMFSPKVSVFHGMQPSSVELSCYTLNNSWAVGELKRVNLECRKHFPQALIIGAKGCGSSVLRNLLAVHPGVATPMQDSNFFSTYYYRDLAWYFNWMPHATERQVTLEKSSEYLTYPGAAERISKDLHDVKVIALLCDPVKRAFNEYFQTKGDEYLLNRTDNTILSPKQANDKVAVQKAWDDYARGNPTKYLRKSTFQKTVLDKRGEIVQDSLYIDKGIYAKHMKQWVQHFPKQRMLILDVDGDSILKHPVRLLNKVEKFLGLSSYFHEDNFLIDKKTGMNCLAKPFGACMDLNSRGRPKPQMTNVIQDKLSAFYIPHNEDLKKLLNITLMYH